MAHKWLGGDDPRLLQIESELGMLRLDGDTEIEAALYSLAELLGAACVISAALAAGPTGVRVEDWRAVRAPRDTRGLLEALLDSPIPGVAAFDPAAIPPRDRDRALDLIPWLDRESPGMWARSPLLDDLGGPLGLAEPHVVGAFVFDGDTLLGWFGAVLAEPPSPRQLDTLDTLIPTVRRRFAVERRLRAAARYGRALEVALDRLGAAAFVLGPAGEIHEANPVARALLESRGDEIADAFADALSGRMNPLRVELRPLADHAGWLATLPSSTLDERFAEAVAVAAARWNLTPRQRDVLECVARGHANATIAETLGISERTVELHVTALLDRAGVDNRASLVSRVLT